MDSRLFLEATMGFQFSVGRQLSWYVIPPFMEAEIRVLSQRSSNTIYHRHGMHKVRKSMLLFLLHLRSV